MEDLYTGKITEFTDWVSGSSTVGNHMPAKKVSGGSIRLLLQDRLKKPFYPVEDTANNKYRIFSSEDAYAIWKENPTDNQDLELFTFVRPSDYKLELSPTDNGGFNSKFIRNGDSSNTGSRIAFHWRVYNDEGDSSEGLSVTYTISNTASGSSTTFTRWYNRSDVDPNFSIYNYLKPGENAITIEGRGVVSGARNTVTFTINLLEVNLVSTFKYYDKINQSDPIAIPYVFTRNNISGTAKIYFKIDNGGTNKEASVDVVQDGPLSTTGIQQLQPTLDEGQHSLQIWAEAKYNDGNVVVHSNLLYYTFTIASSITGSTFKFINISAKFDSGDFPLSDLMLYATQYEAQSLDWGYYTDSLQSNTSIPVTWKLLDGMDDANPTELVQITANSQSKATSLSYVPSIYTEDGHETFLAAYFGEELLTAIPIYIVRNTKVVINETGFYQLKMSAYGKTNDSAIKDQWKDETGTISTTFTGILWNANSGWHDNSFRTAGQNQYATIQFEPFSTYDVTVGKTIEIEFESEKVVNTTDKLIVIGNPLGARIEITPDTATLYSNEGEIVYTNYKSNERIKLAFIINSIPENQQLVTVESGLAYIVNNGILERAATASGKDFNTTGTIKIGGSASGVKVYNLRVYNYSISYNDAFNNYLFDSENKAEIFDNNNILDSGGNISFDLCKNKIDTILISGNLSDILKAASDKDTSTTDVTIERFCPFDSSKNFKINNVQIRKHGQSTLNYPITSMKFWLNKSQSGVTPTYETTQQSDLLLNKNRYVAKSDTDSGKPSIPANKFVLQANYADSSGVHNGGLMRLIQKTWFDAKIDGEYKLRTEPQLFSTSQVVHHNNASIGEDGWTEGYSNVEGKENVLWNSITNQQFPYDIRIAPDSFPCAVFYYDTEGTRTRTFLGQYVWMDDKKSDFTFGERSIYAVPSDPFCLTNTHKDDDTDENLVWDNKNVLRIEVVGSNTPFTSYMTHQGFTDIVQVQQYDTNGNPVGDPVRMYNWELMFEMVYPDEDDIVKDDQKKGIDKFNPNSKYVKKAQPFIDFHEWVVSTYHNQAKFEAEAAQHLDLYKMAAYYIFVLRFGLVDSLERNAQLKTYDGVHWHYEPWDMDIALGNKNDGGIAFNPPIDRNTLLPGTNWNYAISGRSANQETGLVTTSNWLFDALEAWGAWNQIVKEVADALYNNGQGLTYDRVTRMFDEEYAAKWCEIMYNRSGYFKYVQSGKGDETWLNWLQGSRMTHRHWWLSNSMDYYDAKWFCGDYKDHYIYIRSNVTQGTNQYVRITPSTSTYMSVTKDGILQSTEQVSQNRPFVFNMSIGSSTKNPIYFYGANFMEDIDLSEISHGLDGIMLNGVYSEVLGSPLRRLNVGVEVTANEDQNVDADYTAVLASLGCQIQGTANVFENLQYLNIRGQLNQKSLSSFVYGNNITELQEVRAMASGLTDFYSSQSGNNFTTIELPDTVYTFYMNNSTWQNLSFWHTTANSNNIADILEQRGLVYGTDEYYDAIAEIAEETPELLQNTALIKEVLGIPANIHNVSLLGTTGSTLQSIQFVRAWLQSIEASGNSFSDYTLTMDKINWTGGLHGTVGDANLLTYDELSKIALLNSNSSLKGYLVLKNDGVDLTAALLNTIKGWFGDTVFTKNSSGLVIDHERNYVQINFGGDVQIDSLGNATLYEGGKVSLNATRFSLAEDDATQYTWAIGPVGTTNATGKYKGLTIIQAINTRDHIAYINSTQSEEGGNYQAEVFVTVDGTPYSAVLNIIGATYPSDLFINYNTISNNTLKTSPDYVEFSMYQDSADFFIDSNQTYTGVIRNVKYTFTRLSDNATAVYITGGSSTQLTEFSDDCLTLNKSANEDGIRITALGSVPEQPVFYTLSAEVTFASGKKVQTSRGIVVQDDNDAVIAASQLALYNSINTAWTTQFGQALNKNYLFKIDLMSLTQAIDFTPYYDTITSLVGYNNKPIFNYLTNCQGINLEGCSLITSTNNAIEGSNKSQMDFSHMTKLKNLSVKDCTGLTVDIDLTNNPDILSVDARGTAINVFIPDGCGITSYKLGTPTSIRIANPTNLSYTNISVDSTTNLTSLELIGITNNQTFAAFNRIIS